MNKEKEKEEPKELQKRNGGEAVQPFTPFGFMRRFTEDIERLFEEFEGFRFPTLFSPVLGKAFARVDWVPKVEVLQTNGDLKVRAELPGMKKEDVKVELTDEELTISGERKEEKEEKREGFYRTERSYGSFYRRLPLPEGAKTDKAIATFKDGVLEVTLQVPKVETHGRRLEIK